MQKLLPLACLLLFCILEPEKQLLFLSLQASVWSYLIQSWQACYGWGLNSPEAELCRDRFLTVLLPS